MAIYEERITHVFLQLGALLRLKNRFIPMSTVIFLEEIETFFISLHCFFLKRNFIEV